MNQVEIRYSYLSSKAEVRINGEMISPYSQLSTAINSPYLEMFYKVVPGLDKEIFDDYTIDFFGTPFQYKLLLTTYSKSEFCRQINYHEIESLIPRDEIVNRLCAICVQHGITVDEPDAIKIFNSSELIIPNSFGAACVTTPDADIGIFQDVNEIPTTICIPIIYSMTLSYQQVSGRSCIFLPQNEQAEFWDFVELEYMIRPLISKNISALKYVRLTSLEKVELESIEKNVPLYYISEIPSVLDVGETEVITFVSFPPHAFFLKSDDPRIVTCDSTSIIAKSDGTTNIMVVDSQDAIIATRQISVVKHEYVEKIRLIPHFEYLKCGQRSRIDVVISPISAEDANKLTWSISNPDVVQIDRNGNIVALENGEAIITLSGHSAKASFTVAVKPGLKELRFNQSSIRLKSGETVIVECEVTPSDAPTENLTWELDNKTIASINPSKTGRRCQVMASTKYEGKGNVRCYDSNTKLGAICNIEVISKVKQSTAGKIALWCWLLGVILPFLLPVSIIAGIYGISHDHEPDRRTRYIVCTVGSIITLFFWMAAIGN